MIDDLYNITLILEDPPNNGRWFRKSGYNMALKALDGDVARYSGNPLWDEWINKSEKDLDFCVRRDGFVVNQDLRDTPMWPTMGSYLNRKQKGGTTTPHQDFLKSLLHGPWARYSAMAHGDYQGLLPYGIFYFRDAIPHEEREKVDEGHDRVVAEHYGRAALLLLCIVTELQAYFKFHDDGANINPRLLAVWKALVVTPEVAELYDKRYEALMKTAGIVS
jgi:hypothetical protein